MLQGRCCTMLSGISLYHAGSKRQILFLHRTHEALDSPLLVKWRYTNPSSDNLSVNTLLNKHREKGRQGTLPAIITLSEGAKHQGLVRMKKGEFGCDINKDKQKKRGGVENRPANSVEEVPSK